MIIRTTFILLFSIVNSLLLGQTVCPNWIDEDYRILTYPAKTHYNGFAMDRMDINEQLITALQRVENSARNKLIEQIQISIESNSRLSSSSSSVSNRSQRSEVITIDYQQDIRTTTNASAVGVEVKSHFDSNNNIIYAFAYVNKNQLAEYYTNQEEAIFKHVESELNIINNLIGSGHKINALQRCEQTQTQLNKSKDYRYLISVISENEAAYSNQYIALSESVEKLLLSLQQSTKVFVKCVWNCEKYPQYENISDVVCGNIESLLSSNNCAIVPNILDADYILDLTLSTTQRSDGNNEYGIISYYADVYGKLINTYTDKQVVNISFIQDPRLYSAGKNDSQAISKAFSSQTLLNLLKDTVIPGLQK